MENLLRETIEKLNLCGKTPADVRWVGTRDTVKNEPVPCGSWADFARFADFDYDDGYGGAEVNTALVVVGDDWWLERRGEYDGSEWWDFKTLPRRPREPTPLRPADMKDR